MAESAAPPAEARQRGSLPILLGAPRTAARPLVLGGAWLWWSALDLLAGPPARVAPLAALALWPLFALAGLLLWGFTSRVAARDAAGASSAGLAWQARVLLPPDWRLITVPVACLSFGALLFAPAVAGWSLLALLPFVGPALGLVWALTVGAVLGALAGLWLALAVPALPLQVAASVIESEPALATASRGLSYVRQQPLLLAGAGLAVAMASAAAAALAFLLLAGALAMLEKWVAVPELLPHHARRVPAFCVASLFSGGARAYLVLRRAIDGVPLDAAEARLKGG
jgi:hypothetical protein